MIQKPIKNLNDTEINEFKKHGLNISSLPDIFISKGNTLRTDLWFYRTNYAWYWTPDEPNKYDIGSSNWIIICTECSLIAIGGFWDGKEPIPYNIDLIHWFASTRFDYLV